MAGTSPVTASLILSGRRRRGRGASPATYDRIQEAARELGYRPHHAARALIKRRAFTIGYASRAVEYLRGHSFSQILAGVCACAAGHGQNVQCLVTEKPGEGHIAGNHFLDKLADRSVDGVVIFDMAAEPGCLRDLRENGVPFAFLHGRWPGIEDRCVIVDAEGAGRVAFDYLRSLGHERVTMLIPHAEMRFEPNERMANGFVQAAREAGTDQPDGLALRYEPGDTSWFDDLYSGVFPLQSWTVVSEFENVLDTLLCQAQPPTAFFVDSDPRAYHLIYLLTRRGLRVPQDVAVLGFGDWPIAAFAQPKISTFQIPWYQMGYAASEFVLNLVEDSSTLPPPLQCKLLVRESCGGCLPTNTDKHR